MKTTGLSEPGKDFDQQDIPPMGYAVAQLHGVYIIAQTRDGMIIVDTHAAHERITYEALKHALDESGLVSQPLLIPVTVHVSQREAELVQEAQGLFQQFGLGVQCVGRKQSGSSRSQQF